SSLTYTQPPATSTLSLHDALPISAIAGGLGVAVRSARERIGHVHKIAVEVASKNEISEAIESGTNILVIEGSSAADAKDLIDHEIGRAHVELQSRENLVCRLLLEK